jgi:TetR/AcrR family transcriptional repressor of nem operon
VGTNIADFDNSEVEIAAILRHYLQQMEDAYCTAIARAIEAGELSSGIKARDLARMLLCTTQGMALLGRVLDNETLLHSTVEATLTLLNSFINDQDSHSCSKPVS